MNDLPKTMKALVAYGNGDYRLETAYPVDRKSTRLNSSHQR